METTIPPIGLGDMPPNIQEQILLGLPIADMLNLCEVSREFAETCRGEYLWMMKLRNDFPNAGIALDNKWKELYIKASLERLAHPDIFYEGENMGKIWIDFDTPISKIFSAIERRFSKIKLASGTNDVIVGVKNPPQDFWSVIHSFDRNGSESIKGEIYISEARNLILLGFSSQPIDRAYIKNIRNRATGVDFFYWFLPSTTIKDFIDKILFINPNAKGIKQVPLTFGRISLNDLVAVKKYKLDSILRSDLPNIEIY